MKKGIRNWGILLIIIGFVLELTVGLIAFMIQANFYKSQNSTYWLYMALGQPLYLTSFSKPFFACLVGIGVYLNIAYAGQIRNTIMYLSTFVLAGLGIVNTVREIWQILYPPYYDHWGMDIIVGWIALLLLWLIVFTLKKKYSNL
ncbi:hypothetical protein ACFL1A_01750 [Patescibacteria group bacterium]